MPKNVASVGGTQPLLDIGSYARRGPGRRDHLTPAEVDAIQRTVSRTPEVMVKVLTRGATSTQTVRRHLAYLNRGGELEIETDDGERLAGKGAEKRLVDDWDLEVDHYRRRTTLAPGKERSPPRLVHKILFSMPPGTPAQKVLSAVKRLAREEFGAKHRYAMVLHTDEPHPHVHLVVKALSERGERLNIRRETLRRWRSTFAANLRELGVAANATERAVRGAVMPPIRDGLYRSLRSGVARKFLDRAPQSAADSEGRGSASLLMTRDSVVRGWRAVHDQLLREGRTQLASGVETFLQRMPPTQTSREALARSRASERTREERSR